MTPMGHLIVKDEKFVVGFTTNELLEDSKKTLRPGERHYAVYHIGENEAQLIDLMRQRAAEMGTSPEEWAKDVHDSILQHLNKSQ